MNPVERVEVNALRKARSIEGCQGYLIIGADTVVFHEGEILGKPGESGKAAMMLRKLSGKPHKVYTGVTILNSDTGEMLTRHEETTVWFKELDDETIELSALSQILQHEELRQYTHLNVTSYNYLALITGEAPNEALKLVAEKLVKNIDNVRAVYNEVQISAPSAVLSRSSDSLITTKVKTGLFKYINTPKFDPSRVKVVTENGTVFLMGLLTEAEANMVSDYTRTVGGVEKVVKIIEYIPEQKK